MLESLFLELTDALGSSFISALLAAFGWGIVSILFSPCHLSGIPLLIGYITTRGRVRVKRTVLLSILFAIGNFVTVAVIGVITAGLGRVMGDTGRWGPLFVGAVFVIMGLYLMGLLRLDWNGLRLHDEQRGGLLGAFLLGLVFGIGLGPCTFAFLAPLLAVVFQAASSDLLRAVSLLVAFGIGNAMVIALAGSMTNLVQRYLDWSGSSSLFTQIRRFVGLVVLLIGLCFIATMLPEWMPASNAR